MSAGRPTRTSPNAPTRAKAKVLRLSEAARRSARARRRGERVVMTNGCFDLLHLGHVRSLEQARSLGDRLVVAVNLDASVRRLKGAGRPVQPARVRLEVVAALACVDWVVGFGADTPLRAVRAIKPDVLAKGGDWALEDIVGGEDVLGWGGDVARLAIVPGQRTTRLLEHARSGPATGASRPRRKR